MNRLDLANTIASIFDISFEIQDWGDPEEGCQIWLNDDKNIYHPRCFKSTSIIVNYSKDNPIYEVSSLIRGNFGGSTKPTISFTQLCQDLKEVIKYQERP